MWISYLNVSWFLVSNEVLLFILLFLLYKALHDLAKLISLDLPGISPSLTSHPSIPSKHHAFPKASLFLNTDAMLFFFWKVSSFLHALFLPHLVTEIERRANIWGTFPRSQIHVLWEGLVYFAIQSESVYLIGMFLHYSPANSVLYCYFYYYIFYVFISLLAYEFISFSLRFQGATLSAWHIFAVQE